MISVANEMIILYGVELQYMIYDYKINGPEFLSSFVQKDWSFFH